MSYDIPAIPSNTETDPLKQFKERVQFYADRISRLSKKMTLDSFQQLIQTEQFSGYKNPEDFPVSDSEQLDSKLAALVFDAILKPMGQMQSMQRPEDIKTLLDTFSEESSIEKYFSNVETYGVQVYKMETSSILRHLADLDKELQSWLADE